jgi:hypothetical protein
MADTPQNDREHYLQTWTHVLGIFLGWSEDEVMRWADRYIEFMNETGMGIFYHETPIYYIVPELVPGALARKLDAHELMSLDARIETTIYNGDSCCDSRPDFDWHAARDRVERVLNEYGESLRNVKVTDLGSGDDPGSDPHSTRGRSSNSE